MLVSFARYTHLIGALGEIHGEYESSMVISYWVVLTIGLNGCQDETIAQSPANAPAIIAAADFDRAIIKPAPAKNTGTPRTGPTRKHRW
jgi:hypothetical protein